MKGSAPYRWSGSALVPLPRFAKMCAEQFTAGAIYRMKEDEQRSEKSHDHFFGCVKAAFENLPEHVADRFASPEHLRKWALIRSGFRSERTIIFQADDDAECTALLAQELDEFAVVLVEGRIVAVYTAKSQKLKRANGDGMGRAEFEASKEAVLRVCSELIGIDVTTLLAQEAPSISPAQER